MSSLNRLAMGVHSVLLSRASPTMDVPGEVTWPFQALANHYPASVFDSVPNLYGTPLRAQGYRAKPGSGLSFIHSSTAVQGEIDCQVRDGRKTTRGPHGI